MRTKSEGKTALDVFINADEEKYKDQWICIVDNKIVFSGKNIKEGYVKVKEKFKDKKITIARVPGEMNCIF